MTAEMTTLQIETFATYLPYSFTPGVMSPKFEATRATLGIAAHMIAIVTAQELRANLGDVQVAGCTWGASRH